MQTEREIIYNILNTIRDAEHNNDERISERLLRGFLRVYRAESLRKYYKNGHTVDDEVFQKISISPVKKNLKEFEINIPKIIRFQHHYGMFLEKNDVPIPILASEEYYYSKKNYHGKHIPKAKTNGNLLTVYTGVYDKCCVAENSENHLLIQSFYEDLLSGGSKPTINLDFYGVLHNPDDDPNYDWENSVFPFPSERLDELKTQILSKEFGVMIKAKRDEIQNSRSDNIRYHDNDDVTQNS